jgi:CheY-like chemotaxis protein
LPFGESSTADVDADQPVAHSHRRILLIDDDPEVRRVVELLGKSLGHDVISANQTEQIMRLVSEESFDSVLLDLQMPNQDGFDVAQQIRALDLAHQPKIVAITGNALQSVREKALDKGFDEFLAKPFGLHSLADVI